MRVRKINRAAGGVRDGFERVFAGRVAPALVFHRPHDDGVQERIGAQSGAARGLKVSAAGRLAGIGNEHDHAPPPAGFFANPCDPRKIASYNAVPSPGTIRRSADCSDGTFEENGAI